MKTLRALTLFVALLASISVASARLTEKEDELVKRFGEVRLRQEHKQSFESRLYFVGMELRFESDQWTIRALMVDGRCAQITYSKVGSWTDEQIVALLDRNGGAATYKEEPTNLGKSHRKWRQADGITAVFILNKLELTHPLLVRRLALLKAKAEAESRQPPKF